MVETEDELGSFFDWEVKRIEISETSKLQWNRNETINIVPVIHPLLEIIR